MAKTKGSLFSIDASGQVGGTINFSGWNGKTRVKLNRTPKNPRSNDQTTNRGYMAEAVAAWKTLTDEEKLIWEGWKI